MRMMPATAPRVVLGATARSEAPQVRSHASVHARAPQVCNAEKCARYYEPRTESKPHCSKWSLHSETGLCLPCALLAPCPAHCTLQPALVFLDFCPISTFFSLSVQFQNFLCVLINFVQSFFSMRVSRAFIH